MDRSTQGDVHSLIPKSTEVSNGKGNRQPHHKSAEVVPLNENDLYAQRILNDPVMIAHTPLPREEEHSYIPVALARSQLATVVADMHAMKAEHIAKLNQIMEKYQTIESETKTYYQAYITDMKKKANDKFIVEQAKYRALQDSSHANEIEAKRQIDEIHQAHQIERTAHNVQLQQCQQQLETVLIAHEEVMQRLEVRMQHELEAAVKSTGMALTSSHRIVQNQLQMCWEDGQSESLRLVWQMQMLHKTLERREWLHQNQIRQYQYESKVELESLQCLHTIIERVVDMEHQQKRRKRSRELHQELNKLEVEKTEAYAREMVLAKQLENLHRQYQQMEERAVSHTMELIIRSIEAKTPPSQALMIETETQVSPPSSPAKLELSIPVKSFDNAEVQTQEILLNPKLGLASESSDSHLQYEADAELYRERNAELLRSKMLVKERKVKMKDALDKKNTAKARIKTWLSEFQAQHARDPSIEEKAEVKDMYIEFKESEEAYNIAKQDVAAIKEQHHAKVVEIEALSHWHATVQSVRSHKSLTEKKDSVVDSDQDDDGLNSRPDSRDMNLLNPSSWIAVPSTSAEAIAKVEALENQVQQLHKELEVEKQRHIESKAEGKEPISPFKAVDLKKSFGDEDSMIADAKKPSMDLKSPVKAQAESKSSLNEDAKEHKALRSQIESYTREAKSMQIQQTELRQTIQVLMNEITQRQQDKKMLEIAIQDLEQQVEKLKPCETREGTISFDLNEQGDCLEQESISVQEEQLMSEDQTRIVKIKTLIKDVVEQGKIQWNKGDKAKCCSLYVKACEKCMEYLREMNERVQAKEEITSFKAALQEASHLPPAKGSMVLRKQLDLLLVSCEAPQQVEETSYKSPTKVETEGSMSPTKTNGSVTPVNGKVIEEYKQKLKFLETKAKADRVKITQLEAAVVKAESQLNNSTNTTGNTSVLERKLVEMEKKHGKAMEEAEKIMKRDVQTLTQQLQTSQTRSQTLQEQVDKLSKEITTLGGKANLVNQMEVEMTVLREKAAQVEILNTELQVKTKEINQLEANYREEQTLRKKYYNQIEDMKGKIRVYARCRPMNHSENERGCQTCVRFIDEYTLELKTLHGPKLFSYDQMFSPSSSQEEIFEDTKNLLQSAVDGYNVCIFAYGQTGSGKTFTMTGTPTMPGLSPRAIHHLFQLAEESKQNHTITFQAFMLELYNDSLIDLFFLSDGGIEKDGPKLDIKKNERGMVFVSNITMKTCTSAQQTLKLFEMANKKRQVGATKMNEESSRSHSVFSILVENYNHTTKTTSIGKLSLVDLAGSERAGKTGATDHRLKEAQAINKSLSALGDVIAALSSGEKFIPYRNNKLTQLMQDSLGGNAKTLMFVNISPADYNQEETQTSLQYASRVKLITNNANKNSESEQVNKLKAIIRALRAGKTDVDLEGVLE